MVQVDQNDIPRFRLRGTAWRMGRVIMDPTIWSVAVNLAEMRKNLEFCNRWQTHGLPDGRIRLYDDARAEIFLGNGLPR